MSASGGCLVAVLRRLLCSPFRHSDPISLPFNSDIQSPSPNLVARLMGLDSMPMNSQQGKHLRTNSSVSFPEMPVFLHQENDDYLVLTFDNGHSELGFGRTKCKNTTETDKEQNRRCCGSSGTIVNSGTEQSKKKKMKVEEECSSEDSSPVSVLDFGPAGSSRCTISNPRRKLAAKLEEFEHKSGSNEKGRKESKMEVWGSEGDTGFEDDGDVCKDLQVQILDQLLHELVIHLPNISD